MSFDYSSALRGGGLNSSFVSDGEIATNGSPPEEDSVLKSIRPQLNHPEIHNRASPMKPSRASRPSSRGSSMSSGGGTNGRRRSSSGVHAALVKASQDTGLGTSGIARTSYPMPSDEGSMLDTSIASEDVYDDEDTENHHFHHHHQHQQQQQQQQQPRAHSRQSHHSQHNRQSNGNEFGMTTDDDGFTTEDTDYYYHDLVNNTNNSNNQGSRQPRRLSQELPIHADSFDDSEFFHSSQFQSTQQQHHGQNQHESSFNQDHTTQRASYSSSRALPTQLNFAGIVSPMVDTNAGLVPAAPAPNVGKRGYLWRRQRGFIRLRRWKRDFFAIKNGVVCMYNDGEAVMAAEAVHDYLTAPPAEAMYSLSSFVVEPVPFDKFNRANVFRLKVDDDESSTRLGRAIRKRLPSGKRSLYLSAESETEAAHWIASLMEARRNPTGAPPHSPLPPIDTSIVSRASIAESIEDDDSEGLPPNMDWNEVFQALSEAPEDTAQDAIEKSVSIAAFSGKFATQATSLVRVIIDEYALPLEDKTITPVSDAFLRGEGEEMYLADGILLRVVQDNEGVEEEEAAMSLARCELLGVRTYASVPTDTNSTRLQCALTVLVDYKGFRVVAIAPLPVDGEHTLVYGPSSEHPDFATNEAVRAALGAAGRHLHLASHMITIPPNDLPLEVSTSAAVQGHVGRDGRTYIMSLAGVLPPDGREATRGPGVSTRVFRPEFVTTVYGPAHGALSSDAFVSDGPTAASDDSSARKASAWLQRVLIPALVSKLDSLEYIVTDSESLSDVLHTSGVNMRYLGRIAEATKLPYLREVVVVDMIARTAKRVLARSLRNVLREASGTRDVSVVENMLKSCVTDFFNLILGRSDDSDSYWPSLLQVVSDKYGYSVQDGGRGVSRPALFIALQYHAGVAFQDSIDYPFGALANPIRFDQFEGWNPRVKYALPTWSAARVAAERGEELLATRAYDGAVQAMHLKLGLHRSLHGVHNVMAARILTDLGRVYNAQGKYDSALTALGHAVRTGRRFHAGLAKTYLTVMESHYAMNNFQRVEDAYENAVDMVEWHWGRHSPILLHIHAAMAHLYHRDKAYTAAVKYYTKAHDLARKVLGMSHPATAEYAMKLAAVHRGASNSGKAIELYEQAALTFESMPGGASMYGRTLAGIWYNLAGTQGDKGDVHRALKLARKALAARNSVLGGSAADTLKSHWQVALLAERAAEPEIAIRNYEALLLALKGADDDSILSDVQGITKSILKLKLAGMSPESRRVMGKLQASNSHYTDPAVLEEIITQLYKNSPSEYFDELIVQVERLNQDALMAFAVLPKLVEDDQLLVMPDGDPKSSVLLATPSVTSVGVSTGTPAYTAGLGAHGASQRFIASPTWIPAASVGSSNMSISSSSTMSVPVGSAHKSPVASSPWNAVRPSMARRPIARSLHYDGSETRTA